MKPLKEETIIYDADCPMCVMYTGAFIRTGMLKKGNREPYHLLSRQDGLVDMNRARNEIALVNRENGKVRYGLDSLMYILANRWPWMRGIFMFKPFRASMNLVYKFISYNRKVIAPAATFEAENSCTPDFHAGWRWSYIIFSWVITSFILGRYTTLLYPLLESSSFNRELFICGGQLMWQGLIVSLFNRQRVLHYLGNLMTISLAGGLLLLPALALQRLISSPWFFAAYFMLVVSLMLLEHIRRVRLLELPGAISVSWVAYRLVILTLLLLL